MWTFLMVILGLGAISKGAKHFRDHSEIHYEKKNGNSTFIYDNRKNKGDK